MKMLLHMCLYLYGSCVYYGLFEYVACTCVCVCICMHYCVFMAFMNEWSMAVSFPKHFYFFAFDAARCAWLRFNSFQQNRMACACAFVCITVSLWPLWMSHPRQFHFPSILFIWCLLCMIENWIPSKQKKQDENQASARDDHEEESEDVARTETISVDIKRVGSATTSKASVGSEADEPQIPAEVPSSLPSASVPPALPALPDPAERPPSSKSIRSTNSADLKKRPMEFLLRDRSGTEVGMSSAAELESVAGTAASTTDTAGFSGGPRSPSALSEAEDLSRTKSQMSWVSSREVNSP